MKLYERISTNNTNSRIVYSNTNTNINNSDVICKKIKKRNITVYDAYYLLHTFINKESQASSRFRNITSENEVIQYIVENKLLNMFREKNFKISPSIVLYPKLYKFMILIYGQNKIDDDVIEGINSYKGNYVYEDYAFNTKRRALQINIIYAIGHVKLLQWYNQGRLEKKNIRQYFKRKNLEYLLE